MIKIDKNVCEISFENESINDLCLQLSGIVANMCGVLANHYKEIAKDKELADVLAKARVKAAVELGIKHHGKVITNIDNSSDKTSEMSDAIAELMKLFKEEHK